MLTRFDSDLTDAQWDGVYRTVLAPAGYPDSVRGIVDGIRYRERACTGWWLLPPGYPPAETLQEFLERWEREGLWAEVRRVARSFDVDAPDPLRGHRQKWRRRTAQKFRKVPGGSAGLALARLPIQAAQFIGRLFSPHHWWLRRLYSVIHLGDRALARNNHPAAVRWYTRALALAPGHPHPLVGRATAHFALADYPAAIADSTAALGSRLTTPDHRTRAHTMTARALALSGGDLDLAVRHQTEVWWEYERSRSNGDPGIGPAVRLDGLMAAHDDLAEYLINHHMAFDTAMELYRRKPAARAPYLPALEGHLNTSGLILSEDWVRNIGHTAYLDTFAKMKGLGWADWDRLVLVAPPGSTANPHYAGYWGGLYDIVTDIRLAEAVRLAARATGPRVACLLSLPDGSERYFPEALGIVQQAWDEAGGAPLLTLTADDQAYGRRMTKKLGLPDGAWFVCVHVREPGYHKEGENPHQKHRNADIRTYLPAMREIVRRGGWVVRLGDKSMTPLPDMPGVIDYAHSPLKSARMDVVLCGSCRFFVGVASGLCHIPSTFGAPSVLTNWVSNALPVYGKKDIFLPKLLAETATGRRLTFHEMYDTTPRLAAYSGVFLTEYGYEATDNTADEIRDVVVEMIDQLDDRITYTPADLDRQARFAGVLHGHGQAGFSRAGRDFLRAHAALLPTPAAVSKAA